MNYFLLLRLHLQLNNCLQTLYPSSRREDLCPQQKRSQLFDIYRNLGFLAAYCFFFHKEARQNEASILPEHQ